MQTNKDRTCYFTGHHKMPQEELDGIIRHLKDAVNILIGQGVTDFLSDGALGLDQLAAMLIVDKRERGRNVRLILTLPCKDQADCWAEEQKELYHYLLEEADEIVYVSESGADDCMEQCNRYMVDRSAYCICVWPNSTDETAQMVSYARQQGIKVINMASY